jgi:SAM-dependent methyltransferase
MEYTDAIDYRDSAADYDRFAPLRYLPPVIDLVNLMPLQKGFRVLDIGCGTGVAFPVLHNAIGDDGIVVGVDPSFEMIQHASRIEVAQVVLGAAPGLPFHSASFDAAIFSFVLSHISDPELALVDSRRVLRTGGLLGVTSWGPSASLQRDLWLKLTEALRLQAGLKQEASTPLPVEEMLEDEDVLIELLTDSNVRVLSAKTCTYSAQYTADDYVDLRSNLLSAHALRLSVGHANWSDFVLRAREAYRQHFGETFSVSFDAHLVVGLV